MAALLQHGIQTLRRELRPTLRLALPLVLAEIGWMSMGIVDTIMVGRLPDSALAIAAVSLGQSLYYVVAIFGSGLLLGLDTVISHAFGRSDLDDARESLINSSAIALALAPALMGVVALWPWLMQQLGVAPNVLLAMKPFLRALNWSTPFLVLYFMLRRYLQAVHVVKPITFALISANVVNAVGNWILIYGHLGVPALGIAGSGWSTCVARFYMAAVLLVTLRHYNRERGLRLGTAKLRLDLGRIRQLLGLGLPAALQILMEVGAFSAAAALIAKLGAVPLAAHQIALNCAAFTYMVPLGTASAAAVRVGNALGRHDFAAARRAGWMAILLGAAFMSCAGLVFVSMPRLIARIFSPDPQVIRLGATLLLIAAAFQLFDGLQTVATGALRGAGDTRTPMIANFFAYWVIGLPVGYALCFRFRWGAPGLWLGLCIGLIVVGLTLLAAWHRRMHPRRAATAVVPVDSKA